MRDTPLRALRPRPRWHRCSSTLRASSALRLLQLAPVDGPWAAPGTLFGPWRRERSSPDPLTSRTDRGLTPRSLATLPLVGTQPMLQKPMSKVVLSCPDSWAEPAPPYPPSAAGSEPAPPAPPSAAGSESAPPLRVLRPAGSQLVALLGTHEVLTSGQLVRLTGLPERTVQHHFGLLYRAGLVNRVRPRREVGTSPYHCWLTAFGAMAVGAEKPGARSDDLVGVQATAALSELWLSVCDRGKGVGLELRGWRRLPSGLPYQDPHTGTIRELPAEAELIVMPGPPAGREMRLLVVPRTERVPAPRLAAVLARFACFLAASAIQARRCSPCSPVRHGSRSGCSPPPTRSVRPPLPATSRKKSSRPRGAGWWSGSSSPTRSGSPGSQCGPHQPIGAPGHSSTSSSSMRGAPSEGAPGDLSHPSWWRVSGRPDGAATPPSATPANRPPPASASAVPR